MKRLPLLRSCGDCQACCEVMSVDELAKPERTRCVHQAPDVGCAVYKQRPGGCRIFMCLWLAEGDKRLQKYARHRKAEKMFRTGDRPDLSGVLVHPPAAGAEVEGVMIAREVWPGAADEERGRAVLDRLAARGPICLVRADGRRTLAGPKERVDEIVAKIEEERRSKE